MSDPLEDPIEIPAPVKPPRAPDSKSRQQIRRFAKIGKVDDEGAARVRLAAARAKRRPVKTIRSVGVKAPSEVWEALELIAHRFDVSISQVAKKMFQDGVLKYGSPEEIRHAGLGAKPKSNPFDEMAVYAEGAQRYNAVGAESTIVREFQQNHVAGRGQRAMRELLEGIDAADRPVLPGAGLSVPTFVPGPEHDEP